MHRKFILLAFILPLLSVGVSAQKKKETNKKLVSTQVLTQSQIDQKVTDLLSKMTIEEKVGQMAQVTLDVVCKGGRTSSTEPVELDDAALQDVITKYHIGSILNTANNRARTPQFWRKLIAGIQNVAMKDHLGIPVLYGIDAIHGVTYTAGATLFPHEQALAATWNPKFGHDMGEVAAYETRASSIPWNFSPVLDLGLDPRYPRLGEGMGEDPYLIGQFGEQIIKGYEGDDNTIGDSNHVASCMKHFVGYAVPISGKDRTPAYIPDNVLEEYHLAPFKKAIAAGAHTVMINSGLINGVPVHCSYKILTTVLRKELGFKGLIVTDWGDIENLYNRDHVAANNKEAIKMAINAGIDMSMIPYQYEAFCNDLVALAKDGEVPESRIDDAVRHILSLKFELNLFNKPYSDPKDYPLFGSKEFAQKSYNEAAEAITLLKNEDNILPLSKDAKVLVTGPGANTMRVLDGCWSYSWQGELSDEFAKDYNTIFEAIHNKIGDNATWIPGLSYGKEMDYRIENKDRYDEAIEAAKKSDYIVLCLGENSYAEKPGDLVNLALSPKQLEYAQALIKTGKPIVLVLAEGRPRVIRAIVPSIKGILMNYWSGNYGGDALSDILFGDVNPSGKLPITYPSAVNSTTPYIHKTSEEQVKSTGMYNYEGDFSPEFEFGFGLSYTTFEYKNLQLSTTHLTGNNDLTIKVDVTNTGKREGKEVVQLFTSDLVASISPDVKRLRRFEKIDLKAGETKTVTFSISHKDLAFVNADNKWITEPGEFSVAINKLTATFDYQ